MDTKLYKYIFPTLPNLYSMVLSGHISLTTVRHIFHFLSRRRRLDVLLKTKLESVELKKDIL